METIDVEKLKKSLRVTQFFCGVSSVITLLLLIAFMYVFTQLKPAITIVNSLGPVADNVSRIDVNAANEALRIFNQEAVKIDWEKLSTTIKELDTQAINDAVNKLDVEELNAKLSAIDVDALNESLKNLNAAAESLSKLGALFR